MRALWPFARKSLLGKSSRTALLIAAAALATSLVVAVTSGMRTAQMTLESSIVRALGATDARIVHRYAEAFDGALLDDVRTWPGVARATARLAGSLTLVHEGALDSEGRARRCTVQARGIDPREDAFFREVEIESGTRVSNAGEVVLDPQTAQALAAKPGDSLRIARFGAPMTVRVVGIYQRPRLGALQRPLIEIDMQTLATATKRELKITGIAIALDEGIDVTQWSETNASRVQEPMLCEPAERVRTGMDKQIAASRLSTLIATMIAFLSCAAIIATGMTTAVLEELREMGVARAIGASRAQLFGAQLIVGGVIGLLGGVLGAPLGIGIVSLLVAYYSAYLTGGMAIDVQGILIAFAGAFAAGLCGALFPALRAARISPLEALAVRARVPQRGHVAIAVLIALLCFALWAMFLMPSSRDTRFWMYIFGGLPLLHIGWFLLSVPILLVVSFALSRALEVVLRLPRGLLRDSITRMPWRLGCTAGALMVAMSVLVSTRSNGDAIIRDLRERVRFADGFIFATSGLSAEEQTRIRSLPQVEQALPIGYLPLRIAGEQVFGVDGMGPTSVVCVGFEPRPFLEMNRLDWLQGSPETAIPRLEQGDAILVAPEFLIARNKGVGSKLRLGSGSNEAEFEIVGVVTAAGLDIATQTFGMRQIYMEQAVSCIFMDFAAVKRHFNTGDAYMMQLRLRTAPQTTTQTDAAAIDDALRIAVEDAVPGAVFSSGRAIRALVDEIGASILSITSAVALAALCLAAIGVGSVVAAGIAARSREFGVLRAVGGSTHTLVALVLGETIIMALAGICSGSMLGLQLAWMGVSLYRDFAGLALQWVIPFAPMLLGAATIVLVALLAALPSVIRLARMHARALLACA